MGSAFILYMGDPCGFRGSSGAEASLVCTLWPGLYHTSLWESLTACLSKNNAQDTCWQVGTPVTDT